MAPSAGFNEYFPNALRSSRDRANERDRDRPDRQGSRSAPSLLNSDISKADSFMTTLETALSTIDDADAVPGDILNALGSTSSYESTTSSTFSTTNNHNIPPAVVAGMPIPNSALTPLTNIGSPTIPSHIQHLKGHGAGGLETSSSLGTMPSQLTGTERVPARDTTRQVLGQRLIIDQTSDKSISSNDRKNVKPRYREFGAVRTQYNILYRWRRGRHLYVMQIYTRKRPKANTILLHRQMTPLLRTPG